MRIVLISIFVLSSFTVPAQPSVFILQGKWKVEGRESYEVWSREGDGLKGYSSRIRNGEEKITETLQIRRNGDTWVYEATVPDQNEGATIAFKLNTTLADRLSFENPAHDFPVRIQYKMLAHSRLQVSVTGKDGNGFELFLDRLEE